MTKRILFIIIPLLALAACSKDPVQPANAEVTGQVLYGGDQAANGIGYYIRTDNDHAALSPQNLPAEFKQVNINAHVAFRYFDTGSTLNTVLAPGATGPRIIVLRSIRTL